MHLHRAPRLLLGVGPEHLVGYLFLLVRHYVVKVLKGCNQLLHMLRMLLGDLPIGLHVLHGAHRLEVVDALKPNLVHVAGVFAHYLHELIPLPTLGRSNAELGMQLFDPLLDPFFGGPVGRRVSCHLVMAARQSGLPRPLRRMPEPAGVEPTLPLGSTGARPQPQKRDGLT